MKDLKLNLTPEQVDQIGHKHTLIKASGMGDLITDIVLALAKDWFTMYEILVIKASEAVKKKTAASFSKD